MSRTDFMRIDRMGLDLGTALVAVTPTDAAMASDIATGPAEMLLDLRSHSGEPCGDEGPLLSK
jgi:hypothetical protein